jgi:DNA-binding CsgD family transcriptional regulator
VGGAALIGREHERDLLDAFLLSTEGPGALVLKGPAGIGKTTLWRQGVTGAKASGYTVLSSHPAASESALSFAGLSDLLRDVLDDVRGALPGSQQRALEVALLLAQANDSPPDLRLLGSALLNALKLLTRADRVLLAIDDLQWLDAASADVLRFAGRRLTTEPVSFLLAQRDTGDAALVAALAQTFPADRFTPLDLSPLTLGALHHLVTARLGLQLSRPALRRLHDATSGNPLYALELARAIQRRGLPVRADEPLPVPPNLQGLLRERLESLSENLRAVLQYVATLMDPRVATVRRLVDETGNAGAIDEAIAAGVLEVVGDRLAFAHPLLAEIVAGSLGPEGRRLLHLQLASVTNDEERALHLAQATESPDLKIAAEIWGASEHAAARGAVEAAARLGDHATRLTPEGEAMLWARRSIESAVRHTAAGDPMTARTILERVIEVLPAGSLRAEALSQLAWVNLERVDLELAVRLLEQALAEADENAAGEILVRLAIVEGIRGQPQQAERHGQAAVAAAERAGDHELLARALTQAAYRRTLRGEGVGAEARRAVEIELELGQFMGAYSPSICLGQVLMYDDSLEEAREVLTAVLRRADQAGNEEARAQVLFHLGDLERRAGNLLAAEPLAHEASELWRQGGNEQEYGSSLCVVATLDALAGRLDQARETARRGLEIAERIGDEIFAIHHRGVLGLIELTAGEPRRAQEWLSPATDALFRQGVAELSIYPAVQYETDVLATLGEFERLESLTGTLQELSIRTRRSWTAAVAHRSRAWLLAGRGDLDEARASFQAALVAHEGSPQRFEKARTLLALGVLERRAKRKRAAKAALERALALFCTLPSAPWQARTERELARLGLRAAPEHLTQTELRIAELAATGLTNPEIASAAFVSRKTVEANLTKIYRKLGVRSRVELARELSSARSDS